MAIQIPEDLKKVVTFIYVLAGGGNAVPNGTGFFVGIEDRDAVGRWYGYLVTAKHVLLDEKGNYRRSVLVRLNTISGDAEFVELPLSPANERVFTHAEGEVDIAVVPFLPSPEKYNIKLVHQDMLVTRERFQQVNIREGAEVFFTGLFTSHIGQRRNHPIVRFGRVALVSDEPINWKDELLELYLIECQSFGGNSGSPVFFYLGVEREPGRLTFRSARSQFLLAGVMKGSFLSPSVIQVVDTTPTAVSYQNVGIAAVVPAYKLHEILFSSTLQATRESRRSDS